MSILNNPLPKTFLFFALACEAKPFIVHFGFKKNVEQSVFDIYQAHNMVLVITGVGKSAMAAGVAYSLALLGYQQNPVLINIGIAGHKTAALGELFFVEKVVDADTAKQYYPQYLLKTAIPSAPLLTVSHPQTIYATATLYDMESVAFYETATRFTSSELVLMVKVVSDNEQSAMQQINAKQVSAWLGVHLAVITRLVEHVTARAALLMPIKVDVFEAITATCHFTATEKIQLKKSLNQWQVLSDNTVLPLAINKITSASRLLSELNALIHTLPILL